MQRKWHCIKGSRYGRSVYNSCRTTGRALERLRKGPTVRVGATLMLGFLIAFWATPRMSIGHLIFSLGMTIYIFIGIAFEERDLLKKYGQAYEECRRQVSMIIPLPGKK